MSDGRSTYFTRERGCLTRAQAGAWPCPVRVENESRLISARDALIPCGRSVYIGAQGPRGCFTSGRGVWCRRNEARYVQRDIQNYAARYRSSRYSALSQCSSASTAVCRIVMVLVVVCLRDLRVGPSKGSGERQEAPGVLRGGRVGIPRPLGAHVLGPGSLRGGRSRDHDWPLGTATRSLRCTRAAGRPGENHQRAEGYAQGAETI